MKLISTCVVMVLSAVPITDIQSASISKQPMEAGTAGKSPPAIHPRPTSLQPRFRQESKPPLTAVSPAIHNDSSIESRLARIRGYIKACKNPRASQSETRLGLHKAHAEATSIMQQLNSPRGGLALSDELRNSPSFRSAISDLLDRLDDAVSSLEGKDSKLQFIIQQAITQLTRAEKLLADIQKRLEQHNNDLIKNFNG